MLTLEEAKAIANKEIAEASPRGGNVVIFDEDTIAKKYGWIFFFGSRKFAETGDINDMVGGNGPLIVHHNGKVYRLPTYAPPEETIAAFEKEHWILCW
jgi:hypothetical protein